MNLEQINNLQIEDVLYDLRDRLGLALEDEVSQEDLEAEFEIYKAELIADEEARLAEKARKDDLFSRFNEIKNRDAGLPAFYELKSESNAEKYIKNLINDIDKKVEAEEFMLDLEAEDAILVHNINENSYKELRKKGYGGVGEQLDMLFKDLKNGTADWVNFIQSIKDQFPKGE